MFQWNQEAMDMVWPDVQAVIQDTSDPERTKRIAHGIRYPTMYQEPHVARRHPGEVAASEQRLNKYLRPIADKLLSAGSDAWTRWPDTEPSVYLSWMVGSDSKTDCRWMSDLSRRSRRDIPLVEALDRMTVIFGDGGPSSTDISNWAKRVWQENLFDLPDVVVDVPDLSPMMEQWGQGLDSAVIKSRARVFRPQPSQGIPPTAWRISHGGLYGS